ncbi:MAG: HEPN domain-containing protein [Terriglobia bacterium]|jgi:hypothetical protein
MSDEHSLLDEFKLRGYWWLPGEPGNRLPGILHYNPEESIRLELMGAFQGPIKEDSVEILWPLPPVRRPLILGTSDEGEECTLFGTVESPMASGNAENVQVWSNVQLSNLFVGEHFPDERALTFQSMYVGFTHLEEWLGIDPLSAGFNFLPVPLEPTDPLELRLPYRSRKVFEADVASLDAVISLWSSVQWEAKATRSLSLLHRAYFVVDPAVPRDYAWYLQVLQLCRQLLAFLAGGPVYPSTLRTWRDERDIKIYRSPRCQGGKRERCFATRLPFPLIKSQAATVVKTWLDNADRFQPVYDFAVSSHYDNRMNLQAEFLGLAQALEIFDRRQRGGKYEFKQRLQNLFDGLSEQTRDHIGGKPEDFVRTVEDTRNYLVHYDGRPERKELQGVKEYFEANRKLRALLFVLLCKMLGISEEVALIGAFAPGGVL